MMPRPKRKAREVKSTAEASSEPDAKKTKGPVDEYRSRLVRQKKEMYKDPPALPPTARVLDERMPVMSRGKDGALHCTDYPDFKPNLTPAEVLERGSFGGTYFRPIESAVTGVKYGDEVYKEFPAEWFAGLNIKRQVTSSTYRPEVNAYKVSCGGSLGMWESSGWISAIDPYGWFHWYCRFYLGRRSTDDERQISRWLAGHGPKGRFRSQLCNKILATTRANVDDFSVSPVIRQTCQHWAYVLTQRDLDAHKRRVSAKKKA